MTELLAIIFPVFGLVAIGTIAAATRLITAEVGDAVGQFAFVLAMPAFLFRTLARAELPTTIPWGYWLTYFGAVAIAWLLGQVMARRAFGSEPREAVLAGMSVAMANTVMIGIPILVKAYGEAVGVPIALILGLNLPITMTVATLLFEATGTGGVRTVGFALARGLSTHPLFLAILAGLLMSLWHIDLPGPVDTLLASLGVTAVPSALIGLGMSLVHYGLGRRLGLTLTIALMKLMLTPAIVYLIGLKLFALPPLYLATAVVFASAPVGVNVYLFAVRYRTGVAMTSGAIALSSIGAVATTTFWLWVLGLG